MTGVVCLCFIQFSSDNYIPEDTGKGTKDVDENLVVDNEITPRKVLPAEKMDPSNKISMASTANGSLFERTEVLAGNFTVPKV